MHRGTIFIITKDESEEFEVRKSTEFNGGMGLDSHGKVIYEMLKECKNPLQFDAIIRRFDEIFFEYFYNEMTYIADEQQNPFVAENGQLYFDYSQTDNQFKFFRDNNGEYIYTSDSNYIKNITNENVNIVCSNGVFVLKPNQILVADYGECINNIQKSFNKEIDKNLEIEELDIAEYLPTKKEVTILNNIQETLESFDFKVSILNQNGLNNGIEIETWTTGGVDMIHTIYFPEYFFDLYNVDDVNKEIQDIVNNFSVDEEIDVYREISSYKENFTIRESLEDFEEYEAKLQNLADNFLTKYHELIYKKYMKNELEKEM